MPTLRWLSRDDDLKTASKAEYKLLAENPSLGYGDKDSGNLIIQGDNLEALKSLLPFYAGQVKCIYIDPPYNTGSAFEHYDDNLEHTKWLSLMYPRLELLRDFLKEDGVVFIQFDDEELHYAKIICDEIFGRNNFINQIAVEMKLTAGASGGGEDKRLKKNVEYILIYAKNYSVFSKFNDVYEKVNLFALIDEMEANDSSWKYTSVILDKGKFIEERIIQDGTGEPIIVKKYKGIKRTTVNALMKQGKSRETLYLENFDNIFSDTNAQTSIRGRIINEFKELNNDELLVASYVPRSGKDKGQLVEHFYVSPTIRRVIWLKDTAEKHGKTLLKKEKLGTYWSGFPLNNLTKEGDIQFANGKKPELLIQQILKLSTNPNDLVLDSFLGSGTTAAVAHKMGRKYIGIEMGEQAKTHCIPRLRKVIEGEQGGISQSVGWQGGGGFRFFTLGAPVFDENGRIHENITFEHLAAHIFFAETKTPFNKPKKRSTFLGIHNGAAYALLYNGILHDKSIDGGNVLTAKTLDVIRKDIGKAEYDTLVIYGAASRLGASKLKKLGIEFKQTPYDIKGK
jgi:adenine-specific DNA-methyltransferase